MRAAKLDPDWHKARVAARIWLKAQSGRPLSRRDRRLAGLFAEDRGVTNRLIEHGLRYWRATHRLGPNLEPIPRLRCVVVS